MYNLKVYTYPDLSQQFRLYSKLVYTGKKSVDIEPKMIELDPFNHLPVRDLSDAERSIEVSRKRTIDKIYQYSRCGQWEYFVTFTFSKERVNRYDYDACSKVLSQWLRNMKKRYCPNMKYIVVPERHKDGAFHFHGLFSDVSGMDIRDSGRRVVQKFKKGGRTCFRRTDTPIYIFGRYSLGWTTATSVWSNERVTRYITKYVTKDLVSHTVSKKRYWVSKNLDLPAEETYILEGDERMVFRHELEEEASYSKVVHCPAINMTLGVYEINNKED